MISSQSCWPLDQRGGRVCVCVCARVCARVCVISLFNKWSYGFQYYLLSHSRQFPTRMGSLSCADSPVMWTSNFHYNFVAIYPPKPSAVVRDFIHMNAICNLVRRVVARVNSPVLFNIPVESKCSDFRILFYVYICIETVYYNNCTFGTCWLTAFCNPEFQCRIHKGSTTIPILSRAIPIPRVGSHLFKVLSNIVLLSTPRPP